MLKRDQYRDLLLLSMLVVIGVLLMLSQRSLSHLQSGLSHQLAPLLQRITELETRLQPDMTALGQHIDTLSARQLSQTAELTRKISVLEQQITALQSSVAALKKQAEKPLPALPHPPAAVVRCRAPVHHSPRAATAPFSLTGIEYRAGNPVAVLLPRREKHLDKVILLQPGDQWQSWQLISLGHQQARFRHGNQLLQLHVQE